MGKKKAQYGITTDGSTLFVSDVVDVAVNPNGQTIFTDDNDNIIAVAPAHAIVQYWGRQEATS